MNRFLCVLVALQLISVAMAAPAPEPFVSGWCTPVDPDNDCKVTRGRGVLTIKMPGGDHDYDTARKRLNAPRLVRECAGDFQIQIRIRIDSSPSAKSAIKGLPSFVAAGILVIPPDTFWELFLRFQYGVAGAGTGVDGFATQLSRDVKGGSRTCTNNKRLGDWPFGSRPEIVYMRLERRHELLLCKISPDGELWATIGGGTLKGLPSKLKVCLAAYSTSTEPSKVRFDQLKIIRGKGKNR